MDFRFSFFIFGLNKKVLFIVTHNSVTEAFILILFQFGLNIDGLLLASSLGTFTGIDFYVEIINELCYRHAEIGYFTHVRSLQAVFKRCQILII